MGPWAGFISIFFTHLFVLVFYFLTFASAFSGRVEKRRHKVPERGTKVL
jgi:hypothetical protein